MLTKKEVWARFLIAVTLFLLSGTGTVNGYPAIICGVLGTVELATVLLRYSPLMELLDHFSFSNHYHKHEIVFKNN